MAAASELDREEMITKWIQESLDSSALEGRLQEFRQVSRFSSAATGLLFLFVFVVSPILIWRLGFALLWPWLLGGLVVLCVLNAIAFYRAHKRLHPELDDERFAHFLMALLFPPAGMRVRDTLSRPLVERFHALAVAKATCAPDEFAKIAGRVVRELKFPRRPLSTQPTNAEPARRWFNQAMLAEVIRFLSKNNLTMDSLLCPPERTDPEGRSYCPRCQAQFTMDSGVCSDCGVVLVEFSRF